MRLPAWLVRYVYGVVLPYTICVVGNIPEIVISNARG